MKKIALTLLLVLTISCGKQIRNNSDKFILNKLETCFEASDFFSLKEVYDSNTDQLSQTHSLYYGAIISNVFNQAEKSNQVIDELLQKHTSFLNDTMINELYAVKILNHVNLYEYGEAAKSSAFILHNFEILNDSNDVENLRNEIKIWDALSKVPKQQIIKSENVTIPMVKDKVGLFNVDVTFGETTKNLLFDTGANFSVIVRSLAVELGFPITEADFYVTAATGLKVRSDIAIAPEIEIGGIILGMCFSWFSTIRTSLFHKLTII